MHTGFEQHGNIIICLSCSRYACTSVLNLLGFLSTYPQSITPNYAKRWRRWSSVFRGGLEKKLEIHVVLGALGAPSKWFSASSDAHSSLQSRQHTQSGQSVEGKLGFLSRFVDIAWCLLKVNSMWRRNLNRCAKFFYFPNITVQFSRDLVISGEHCPACSRQPRHTTAWPQSSSVRNIPGRLSWSCERFKDLCTLLKWGLYIMTLGSPQVNKQV